MLRRETSLNDLRLRRRTTASKIVDCFELPFTVYRSHKRPLSRRSRRNAGVVLWSLLMSFAQIAMLLNTRDYNEVVATMCLVLSFAGLMQARLADNAVFPASLFVSIPQVSLLFGVMSMIAASRKVNYPIDSVAWRILFVSKSEKEQAFGSLLDFEHVVAFFSPVYKRALLLSTVFAAIVLSLMSLLDHRAINQLKRFCRRSLFFFFAGAGLMLIRCFAKQLGGRVVETGPSSCTDPPHVAFRRKPNLIIITIDSWRRDTVDQDSMPRTMQWLHEPKPGMASLEWKNHDSCSVQSDQGYAGLFYGMKGLKREKLRYFTGNKEIKSWPLDAARSNGYEIHKVTPSKYDFCWLLMDHCDLYTRGFDTINGINMTEAAYLSKESIWKSGGSKVVFDSMEELLERQHRGNKGWKPMVISADLQDLHHPLGYETRPNIDYSFPIISLRDLYRTYSGELEITKENKADLVLQLRNRVKNALLNLDDDIATWLDKVRPYLDDTIMIMTGDHAELYFDGEENFIWHGVNNPIDQQRQVPMLLHGPKDLVSMLEVPEGTVTCHSDVLPSVLEALAGNSLGTRWKEELDYNSYFTGIKSLGRPNRPNGFAYCSLHEFQVLIQGSSRLHMQDGAIKEARRLDDESEILTDEEAKAMADTIAKIEDSTWPGLNNQECLNAQEKPENDLY